MSVWPFAFLLAVLAAGVLLEAVMAQVHLERRIRAAELLADKDHGPLRSPWPGRILAIALALLAAGLVLYFLGRS